MVLGCEPLRLSNRMSQSDPETSPHRRIADTPKGPGRRLRAGRGIALAAAIALGSAALFALAGCPANLANPQDYAPPAPTAAGGGASSDVPVPACMTTIISASCSLVGCHSKNAPAAGLDLVSPNLSQRLIDVSSTHQLVSAPNGCVPNKLIDSANPSTSWLVQKLTDTMDCGFLMPIGPPLTADQIACFSQYASDVHAKVAGGGT